RWLAAAWNAARAARASGVDVRAVTPWALLGRHAWDSLLTPRQGPYQAGASEGREGVLRPAAIAGLARHPAHGGRAQPPVVTGQGWWRRPARLACPPVELPAIGSVPAPVAVGSGNAAPILITGATGTLRRAFARICLDRGLAHRLLGRSE